MKFSFSAASWYTCALTRKQVSFPIDCKLHDIHKEHTIFWRNRKAFSCHETSQQAPKIMKLAFFTRDFHFHGFNCLREHKAYLIMSQNWFCFPCLVGIFNQKFKILKFEARFKRGLELENKDQLPICLFLWRNLCLLTQIFQKLNAEECFLNLFQILHLLRLSNEKNLSWTKVHSLALSLRLEIWIH